MTKISDKHLNRRLLNAVIDENYKECQFLLNNGANPNHLFNEHDGGISSFHIAVGVDNDLEFTRLFLNHKADVHLKCKKLGWTVLHVCAHWNKHKSLQLLLVNKADPNLKCKQNKNVLQTAIENNSNECIQILRDFMRNTYLRVFTNINKESDLDLTSVSSISLNDSMPNSYSFIKTSTFDDFQLNDTLKDDEPPPIPPRTHLKAKEHVYVNIDKENNDNEKTPTKTIQNRFQSPEKLPKFYYKILEDKNKTTVNQETQTNAKCVTIKQSDLKKASPSNRPSKVISPEDIINYYNKQQPEQIDNNFPAYNIYSKFKNWVSKLNLSPLIGNTEPDERQSRSRLQERNVTFQQKSLSPSSTKRNQINQRSSSLSSKLKMNEPKEVSFSHLNEFITDEIGSDFFNSVMGKSNSSLATKTITPIKATDGKIYQTDLNEIKSVSNELLNLRQEAFNSSIITFDNSTVITNDFAQLEDENNRTFTDKINNNLNDLVESFQNLNTNSLTEQLKFINLNLSSKNTSVIGDNMKGPILLNNNYSNELYDQIENKMNTTDSSEMILSNMFNCFHLNPHHEWREGNIKSAFNYLLIDPRISQNLPIRAKFLNEKQVFRAFIASIFYIGKGTRARPYAHLQDTIKIWKHETNQTTSPNVLPKKSKKIERIINIWENNYGVVSLHCFQNVIPSEAYTREAAMIDAIGIHNLTNVKKGNYYGEAKEWSLKHKCQLGTILLRNACKIFLSEGERQLNPVDIKM